MREIRSKIGAESGFTLVELLAVMLILGLLAALAIPAFFSQSVKARDAKAKEYADTAQTAIELVSREAGDYSGITAADLVAEEATLSGAALAEPVTTANTYTLEVVSSSGTTFSVGRTAASVIDFDCAPRDTGGCPLDGNWAD